jgi:RND family efflux transporter MFP subunit
MMIALTGCSIGMVTAPTPTPVPEILSSPPAIYSVQRGLVQRQIQFNARVQPVESRTLVFDMDGKVRKVNVKGGDNVKKGDVLAELDLTEIRTQLQQANIQMKSAESALIDTQLNYTRTLQLAQLDYQQATLRLEAAIKRLNNANANTISNDLVRNAKLIEDIKRSISEARAKFNQAGADNAEKLLKNAEIDREKLQAKYSEAMADLNGKEVELNLLRNEVERARLSIETKKIAADPLKIQAIEAARVNVEALKAKELRGSLIAPFDGQITLQPLSVGDNVRQLDPTMIIAQPGELEIVTEMSDTQLLEISVGQPISATVPNLPNRALKAVIKRVPVLTNTTAKDKFVRIALTADNPPVKLESGMLARCEVILGKKEDALWLPPQAIRNFRGRQYVVVQEADGKQRRADVITGLESRDRVEIVDGVKLGEQVIGQ